MAAFNHGFEEYGVSILRQYFDLISEKNEPYLWYCPDGTPTTVETSTSPEAMPTDGWGSSAMVWALIEGLAGIEDKLKRFEKIRLSPRWIAAGVMEAEAGAGYQVPASAGITENMAGYRVTDPGLDLGGKESCHNGECSNPYPRVRYLFQYTSSLLCINLQGNTDADFHVLIKPEDQVRRVEINGLLVEYQLEMIERSQYVNFSAVIENQANIRINFKG
jgi:hypothetical protein